MTTAEFGDISVYSDTRLQAVYSHLLLRSSIFLSALCLRDRSPIF